jgi:hypothetical protein
LDANNGPKTTGGVPATNGQSILSWTDRSTNSHTVATGSHAPTLVTNVIGGSPVVRFNGSNDYLTNATYNPGNVALTYFMVERNLNGGAGVAPYSWGSSSGRNSGIIFQNNSGMQPTNPKKPYNSATGRIWCYIQTLTGGDNTWMNGASSGIDGQQTGTIAAPFDVGRRNVSSLYTSGDIAEIIIYHRALTATERTNITAYLSQKYSITVS